MSNVKLKLFTDIHVQNIHAYNMNIMIKQVQLLENINVLFYNEFWINTTYSSILKVNISRQFPSNKCIFCASFNTFDDFIRQEPTHVEK